MKDKMSLIQRCRKHFITITKHKWFVFIECCKLGIIWQGITHDLSKYSLAEFIPSAKYFQGNRSPIEAEKEAIGYSYAWRNHKGKNKHHWQWYIDTEKNEDGSWNITVAPMPLRYIKEMVADMIGAGKAYSNGKSGLREVCRYYHKKKYEWVIHEETQKILEDMIGYPLWLEKVACQMEAAE